MLAAAALPAALQRAQALAQEATSAFGFRPLASGLDATHHLAEGYNAQTLLRWGDAVLPEAPTFAPLAQSAQAQAQQFGYNNDFIAYFPIDGSSQHGLLCINHEYVNAAMMFTGSPKATDLSEALLRTEMQAVGCSIIEVKKQPNGEWQPLLGKFNRRISATTPMQITGAAAGHARLRTRADAAGTQAIGTFANCAGGQTPWNSYLTCEENVDDYFWLGNYDGEQAEHHRAMGITNTPYQRWDRVEDRFNVSVEPNEPNRFGWVVEIDPFDPQSTPKKRTSLGRFKHECATVVQNADGRIVVYSGDDEYFQCLYKYVSAGRYEAGTPHDALLDDGTLYAARFDADGSVQWLPLVYGAAPLNEANGFASQGDVLIETRRAAKLMGATPMDRPEDIAVHPKSGHVFASLTQNPKRLQRDAVNRRAPNLHGYILEIIPPAGDHAATQSRWEIALEGGKDSLACPDNLAFDAQGTLWIATDGQQKTLGISDGLYALDVSKQNDAATPHCFFRAPIGAEVTGPCFTPDGSTLFVSVQHPAEKSSYDKPTTRWPDFDKTLPPRPSVLAITKTGGGVIGS